MLPFADLATAIRQRYRIELAIFFAVLILVAAATFLAPKVYTSTATLLFDEGPIDPSQGEGGESNLNTLLSTQADVIQSDLVAARVVNDLHLINPDILVQWRKETGGLGDVNLWYGARLLSNLTIAPDRASRVLRVSYDSSDGTFSAAMANGFVKAYLEQKLELQTDPAKTYSRWYVDRTREVRNNLENTQAKLTAFRRRTGIVDDDSTNAESSRLNELQAAVTGAEVGAADLRSRSGGASTQSPDVQNSAVVLGLRSGIAQKAAQIRQLSVALGPNHPERQAAEAELAEMNAKLNAAIAQQDQAIRVASSAASTKEAALRNSLGTQKARMLTLAADRAEYDVLRRDVESARTAYDQVTQRLDVMRLSAAAPTAGARQLDSARAPMFPSEPKIPLRLLLGTVMAAMLAIGVGVILEFIRPVVRSTGTLQDITGVPVITTIDFRKSRASDQPNSEKIAA